MRWILSHAVIHVQVLDILARLSIAERASIDECYLDITLEASKRLAACSGYPYLPILPEQVHVCGEVRLCLSSSLCSAVLHACQGRVQAKTRPECLRLPASTQTQARD